MGLSRALFLERLFLRTAELASSLGSELGKGQGMGKGFRRTSSATLASQATPPQSISSCCSEAELLLPGGLTRLEIVFISWRGHPSGVMTERIKEGMTGKSVVQRTVHSQIQN